MRAYNHHIITHNLLKDCTLHRIKPKRISADRFDFWTACTTSCVTKTRDERISVNGLLLLLIQQHNVEHRLAKYFFHSHKSNCLLMPKHNSYAIHKSNPIPHHQSFPHWINNFFQHLTQAIRITSLMSYCIVFFIKFNILMLIPFAITLHPIKIVKIRWDKNQFLTLCLTIRQVIENYIY